MPSYYELADHTQKEFRELQIICENLLRIDFNCPEALKQACTLINEGIPLAKHLVEDTAILLEGFDPTLFNDCLLETYVNLVRSTGEAEYLASMFCFFEDLDLCSEYIRCTFIESVRIANNVVDRAYNQIRAFVDRIITAPLQGRSVGYV